MYARGFVPWIIFACFPQSQIATGALTALIVAAFLGLQDLRRGIAPDALVLEISTVAYFALLTIAAHVSNGPGLGHWSGVLAFSWLALTAWVTLAIRHPFTLGIARKTTPREYWHNPVFLRINVVITLVWATAFTITALAIAASHGLGLSKPVEYVFQVLGFAIPAIFTARYPKIAQARAVAAASS
jgi:hypothetical protein